MSEELKPCPFCPSTNIDPEGFEYDHGDTLGPCCSKCFASVKTIEEWQTRPTEDALREENARLREALGKADKQASIAIYGHMGWNEGIATFNLIRAIIKAALKGGTE